MSSTSIQKEGALGIRGKEEEVLVEVLVLGCHNPKHRKTMQKLRVGILGATGTVGQRMIQLLERHPWFEVSVVCASDNSAGKSYIQATKWMLETPIPEAVAKMTVQSCQPISCDFVL